MNQTFPKREHLKRKKIIDRLFVDGKKIKSFPLLLVFAAVHLPEDVTVQVGVSVSKRSFKNAVDRNRMKRLMREAYRKNKSTFKTNGQTFAFMFIYMGREEKDYASVESAMVKISSRFNEAIQQSK